MKLFYSPIHAFAHKALITAHEAGVWDQIVPVAVYPFREGYDLTPINPLGKVPTLALDDGTVIYGSQPARSMRRTACEPSAAVRLISSR